MKQVLGIDIGGTGIKGGIVDLEEGILISDRFKYKTPKGASPEDVLEQCKNIVADAEWEGKPIGIGFPSTIHNGVCMIATNISKKWIGKNMLDFFSQGLNTEVEVLNDADAAGLAESKYGNGKGVKGLMMLLTLGTGVGSGLFINGVLVPNTELGLMFYKDSIVEHYVSNKRRESEDLSWKVWGNELNRVLNHYKKIFSPELILLSGGVSKKFEKYEEHLDQDVQILPASLQNNAGIVGAACSYVERNKKGA